VTSIYLQGIDPGEIIETIHARRPPMIPASADSSYGSEPERRGCRFSTFSTRWEIAATVA
jgi:hypothetical protein